MNDNLIEATGLQTYYGASHVLRGVDFSVGRGETVGLMGRNGMGKSTLLKSLMGLVKPRGGQVRVMGRDLTGAAPYEVAQLGVAYVPEGRGIFGNLSVVENLKMAASSYAPRLVPSDQTEGRSPTSHTGRTGDGKRAMVPRPHAPRYSRGPPSWVRGTWILSPGCATQRAWLAGLPCGGRRVRA